MERNFETVMVEQCAPVLAGIKPANLFRHETRDKAGLARTVARWNAQLNGRGLRLRILKECPQGHWYLLYLYRPARLGAILAGEEIGRFFRTRVAISPAAAVGSPTATRTPPSGILTS